LHARRIEIASMSDQIDEQRIEQRTPNVAHKTEDRRS
jgi:hypothetical protein